MQVSLSACGAPMMSAGTHILWTFSVTGTLAEAEGVGCHPRHYGS